MTESTVPLMPEFSLAAYGFHHTIDSALETLLDLKVPSSRISIRMLGRGFPSRWVVRQSPPAGRPIGAGTTVTLSVGGLGFFHQLPSGMWDKGGESEPGTQEMLEILDDPVQKASHWVRDGARLFDISPDNPRACSRWISLFGLSARDWSQQEWYRLALLLPSLHRLAGRKAGIRLALELLLQLPLMKIIKTPAHQLLQPEELTFLGGCASRLGVDTVLGDRKEDLRGWTIVLGPVTLERYRDFQREENQRLLSSAFDLCLACHQQYRVRWSVGDANRAPRLGLEEENARLGINSHLGQVPGEPAAIKHR